MSLDWLADGRPAEVDDERFVDLGHGVFEMPKNYITAEMQLSSYFMDHKSNLPQRFLDDWWKKMQRASESKKKDKDASAHRSHRLHSLQSTPTVTAPEHPETRHGQLKRTQSERDLKYGRKSFSSIFASLCETSIVEDEQEEASAVASDVIEGVVEQVALHFTSESLAVETGEPNVDSVLNGQHVSSERKLSGCSEETRVILTRTKVTKRRTSDEKRRLFKNSRLTQRSASEPQLAMTSGKHDANVTSAMSSVAQRRASCGFECDFPSRSQLAGPITTHDRSAPTSLVPLNENQRLEEADVKFDEFAETGGGQNTSASCDEASNAQCELLSARAKLFATIRDFNASCSPELSDRATQTDWRALFQLHGDGLSWRRGPRSSRRRAPSRAQPQGSRARRSLSRLCGSASGPRRRGSRRP